MGEERRAKAKAAEEAQRAARLLERQKREEARQAAKRRAEEDAEKKKEGMKAEAIARGEARRKQAKAEEDKQRKIAGECPKSTSEGTHLERPEASLRAQSETARHLLAVMPARFPMPWIGS